MALIQASHLSMAFGENVLFNDIHFEIQEKDHIGLIGDNGTGKTTLLKIIIQDLEEDGGHIRYDSRLNIGYMEQHVCRSPDITAYAEVLTVFSRLMEIEETLEYIGMRLQAGNVGPEEQSRLVDEQTKLHDEYLYWDGLTYRNRTKSVLLGLGFTESQIALPVRSLSGGQKAKLQLAKLLLSNANLLLLDEPTNHLDIFSIEWLESFLSEYKGAYIVISHDRYFLDKVTSRTWELDQKQLHVYKGNYTVSRHLKEEQSIAMIRHQQNTMAEIERLNRIVSQQRQWNREKNIKTAESKLKMIHRLEETLDPLPGPEEQIHFDFTPLKRGGNDVLNVEGLSLSFDDDLIFEDVSFSIQRGERVFLLGDNGCGKTSLFKTILQKLSASAGKVSVGADISIGYYDQIQDQLDLSKTVLETVWDRFPSLTQTQVRNALAQFLFRGDDVFKEVSSLSGGERARILLLLLMMSRDNFLMLDEPTNHLDIKSCETLENALSEYTGTMLIISHDRYLINKLADRVILLQDHHIRELPGNYESYLQDKKDPSSPGGPAQNSKAVRQEASAREPNKADLRKIRSQIRDVEKEIDSLEQNISSLENELNDPEIACDYQKSLEITDAVDRNKKHLEELMEEWEALSEKLE